MIKKSYLLTILSLIVFSSFLGLYLKYSPKESINKMTNINNSDQDHIDFNHEKISFEKNNHQQELNNHLEQHSDENINSDDKINQPANICHDDHKKYIVFDVGQVLLENSSTGAAKAVGVSHMFWYTVKHKKTPESKDIQARLFDFIDYCTQKPRGHALFNGQPLPALMCEWAKGKIDTSEILKIVTHYTKQAQEFFISEEEKNLVFGALNLFKPDVICNIQKPNTKMVNLFIEYNQKFPNQVCILSNWDRESANLITKKFPQIFNAIPKEQIFFSGDIGELKPEASAFNYLTNQLKICPKNCILIDDNAENVKMARSLGWKAILHKHPDKTARKLKRLTK